MSEQSYSFGGLDRLFHAPARLGLATALYTRRQGMSFSELKQACELSDGNLSRHISRMEEESAVRTTKEFVGRVPRTTIALTAAGRARFERYIEALQVIVDAQSLAGERTGNNMTERTVYE